VTFIIWNVTEFEISVLFAVNWSVILMTKEIVLNFFLVIVQHTRQFFVVRPNIRFVTMRFFNKLRSAIMELWTVAFSL